MAQYKYWTVTRRVTIFDTVYETTFVFGGDREHEAIEEFRASIQEPQIEYSAVEATDADMEECGIFSQPTIH